MLRQFHPATELFPMLDEEALEQLAASIAKHGLRHPIRTIADLQDPTRELILDGRNRAAACDRLGIVPATVPYEGDDPTQFVIDENLHRRHLTAGQKAYAAMQALPLLEADAKKRQQALAGTRPSAEPKQKDLGADRRQGTDTPSAKKKRAPRSAAKAAKLTGVSERAVERMKRVTEQAPDLVEKVRTGETTLDRAERIIRDRDAEAKRVEQAKQDAALTGLSLTVDLRVGDFREALADLRDVDAIITDPPYPHEFLPLLGDLATWADRVLKPDGVLVVLIGQSYLPDVYRLLEGGRPYRWTACYLTAGAGYVSHHRRLQSGWKPLLVYGGGPRFSDVVRSSGDDKAHHRWGQDYSAFHEILERFTERGNTVADPFMGGGTTLLAAHALGRHAIGADIDADAVEAARKRFA